ncbi:hypothetical protein C8035_v005963 [Colletotrichum spinosum]|uniref:Uncharacterized protein n=1 Tax=Colletotrichum spinosum TaxID=1347390 RepID=A0A4R8PZH8_9PEZI|nr:hypothetical protein C8035_v005963 [Colletotrichum spinosum]
MCNYVTNITKCRQCGSTISEYQSDYVYCVPYRNGIACATVERSRNTTLTCCSSCQNSYQLAPLADAFTDTEDEDDELAKSEDGPRSVEWQP